MSLVKMMLAGRSFQFDLNSGFDISIALRFQGNSLSAFGCSSASLQTVENKDFIGDTRRNGSCNVDQYTLIPHCHGTHTECVGHIVNDEINIVEILKEVWMPALVITVKPEKADACTESYSSNICAKDELISKQSLNTKFAQFVDEGFQQALIIRTLPNDSSKKTRHYASAAYFSNEAMLEIANRPVQHLLVDLPSVDRMDDQGELSNHRIFWGLEADDHSLAQRPVSSKTITEFIYIDDEIEDGYYMLNLQLAPFIADAAPSRPMVFPAIF